MNFQQFNELKDKYKQEIKENGLKLVQDAFNQFFEEHPNIKTVQWRQYTPYFNDGEPCEFGVQDFWYTSEEFASPDDCPDNIENYAYDKYGGKKDEVPPQGYAWQFGSSVKNFEKNLRDEEFFKSAFGDHVSVTFTRNWHLVNSYTQHD